MCVLVMRAIQVVMIHCVACVRVRATAVSVLRSEDRIRQVHVCAALFTLDGMQHMPQCALADHVQWTVQRKAQ